MSPGARGLFRICVVKDAEAIARSGDAGLARSDGATAPIESESELILDLHQAIRAGDGMARQIAGTWLDKHEAGLSEALEPLGEIRARLDRSENAGAVDAPPRPENRRSRKRFSCDEATRQLIGDAVVASAIARPERGEQQAELTRALQTANYLLGPRDSAPRDSAPRDSDGAADGRRARLRPLTQTPVMPAGLTPARSDRARRPEADAGGPTGEPLSWRMAAGALETLRAVDADALLAGQSEAAIDRVLVPAGLAEGLPGPLRDALAERKVDPAAISLIGLVEHLTELRAALYRGERRLACVAAGRPFEPGEWRDLPGLGWRYVLPPSAAPMPPPSARVAASADWTYVDGVGWVLVANAGRGRGEDLVSREAADGASVRILGVADLLSVEERRVRYRAGEIAPAGNGLELPTARPTNGTGNRGNGGMDNGGTGNGFEPAGGQRFTLEHAISEVMAEDRTTGFGALVAAGLGPSVPLDGGPGLEHRTADELARRTASRYADGIIERAITRIRAGRTEPGRHGSAGDAANTGGGRRSAAYRWIDGIHELHTVSLGKRLMIEAVIPEPGAWLRHRRYSGPAGPAPPAPFAISFEDVTEDSYAGFAATWQAGDIKPPPAEYRVVGTAATLQAEPEGYVHHTGALVIPAGYRCTRALATLHRGPAHPEPDDDPIVTLAGQRLTRYAPGRYGIAPDAELASGELPFTFGALAPVGIGVPLSITAICRRIDGQLYTKWRIDTFDALLRGYRRLKSEHDASAAGASRDHRTANREAEMGELRRLCTEAIAGCRLPPSAAVREAGDACTHMDVVGADRLAALIGFFGDAFEWDNISCDLYPHFRAGEEQPADEPDPRHRAFLGAGAARVRIPVRPGAERDVLYFLDFGGLCPNNAGLPVARERLALLSDIEAFNAARASHGQPRPYGEPWLVRVPTPAVTPADGSGLPDDWIALSTAASGVDNDNDHDEG